MSPKKGANFLITTENKSDRVFRQVYNDLNRMTTAP